MRLRSIVLATALVAFAPAAIPGAGAAAPSHNRGLTIHAVPNSIIAGEGVLIYGRLRGPGHGDQVIRLYHRLNPFPIGTTHTNSAGYYEFIRAEGIVTTNRSWYTRGPLFTHSRTVHERVEALVSLAASSPSVTTRHPITFSGHLTPDHTGEAVVLQAQKGSTDHWTTLKRGSIGPGSNYQIPFAFRTPGAFDVRVLFRGDRRNIRADSDPVPVTIQQTEVPDFTIFQTSEPIVSTGSPDTIFGTLFEAGTTTREPNTMVSLFARVPQGGPFKEVTSTMTGSDGSYQFDKLESAINQLYEVRTTFPPARHTAVLFEGVRDAVTISSSSPTSTVGGHITFTGSVSPDTAGHSIYLQRFGKDNNWHTVETRFVNAASTFEFGWTFWTAGAEEFRAKITGVPANVGGASPPVTIAVTLAPLSLLPTG
jgi:hypothetical protein